MNKYNKMVNESIFPSEQEIFTRIEDLTQWGHRKTGTPEGRKSMEYIRKAMLDMELSDVLVEEVPTICMEAATYNLEIAGEKIESFYVNGTNRGGDRGTFGMESVGKTGEFVYLGKGTEEDFSKTDVNGKIVLCDILFKESPPNAFLSWNEKAFAYDPGHKMDRTIRKYDIYSPNNWPDNYFYAMKAGAAGFVGILENYPDCYYYNEDYTESGFHHGISLMSLPAQWVSRQDGIRLREKFASRTVLQGKMETVTSYEEQSAFNISGRLKGASDEIILIHSHHDAVFNGAVQDASGVAEVLAIASYFSQLPESQRKKTMIFAATDTHFAEYVGHRAFIEARKKAGDKIILDLVIEHIGKEVELNENMQMNETGEIETRMLYVTEHKDLLDIARRKVEKYDLEKTVFMPSAIGTPEGNEEYEFRQDEIISDAFYFNESGIPVISMVAGQMYLFHPSDMLDRVCKNQLRPVGMAFAEMALEAAEW